MINNDSSNGVNKKARGRLKLIRFRQPRAMVRPGRDPSYTFYYMNYACLLACLLAC
ncbi:MAG: hypothetical protein IJX44_03030 [Bacteroidaceae bacterium]|nr:hypothetical protein [Bacteroidaceae bacterium]